MADYGTYCDLSTVKSGLDITDTKDDARLLLFLQQASRAIDSICRRFFYCKTQTRYYDGEAGRIYQTDLYTEQISEYLAQLWVDDLLSVTTLKFDSDGDATYEDILATTDYILWPYSDFPKLRIDLDLRQGDYSYFPRGQKRIEIAGLWGYGDGYSATPYVDSGATITVANGTATTVTVSDQSLLAVGQTILVESEQMYIRALYDGATDTALVYRGTNGTSGASHTAKAAYVYSYPEGAKEAVQIGASKLFKRKDSSFATMVGTPTLGQFEVARGMSKDPDIMDALAGLMKGPRVRAV